MSQTPTRLLIHGANGRMGQALQRLADHAGGCQVVAAVSRKVGPRVIEGIPQFAASELAGVPEFDAAIDFSLPEGFDAILGLCVARGRPLVSGTTGLSDAQLGALQAASARIPLVWASNFSLGVAVLHDLVERAARALPGWDCDIVEAHHTRKLDAPSGTAKLTAQLMEGEVPIHSVRLPGLVAHQEVILGGTGETLTIRHDSLNRESFMPGVVLAVREIGSRPGVTVGLEHLLFPGE